MTHSFANSTDGTKLALFVCPKSLHTSDSRANLSSSMFLYHRGFRRVTSEKVPDGWVAYYHNSFRKDEQHLLRSMGIGKKNDSAVQDIHAFGQQPMIGAAGAAAAVAAAAAGSPVTQRPSLMPGAVASPTLPRTSQASSYSIDRISSVAAAAAAALPSSPSIQESKADAAHVLSAQAGGQQDLQQILLEAMLSRQHQADLAAALQRQRTSMFAESIRRQQLQQQQQQQQQRVAALGSAMEGRNDHLTRQLTLLAAQQQQSQFLQPAQPLSLPIQQHQGNALSSDPAVALLLQDYIQRQSISAASGLPTAASQSVAGLANANTTAAPPAANDLLQSLLREEQRRRAAQQGQGPGQPPAPAPPHR